MGRDFWLVVGIIICISIMFRLLLCEIDGKNNIKRSNLAYFLRLSRPFSYQRSMGTHFFVFGFIFLFTGFTLENLKIIIFYLILSIILDVIGSVAYHYYGRYRFKDQIIEAKKQLELITSEQNEPYDPSDIEIIENGYNFLDVVSRYVPSDGHMACLSNDGGEFFGKLPYYSQVSFLIDGKYEQAVSKYTDTPIKVVKGLENLKLPFKDGRLDLLVCDCENMNPDEASRVLKNDGILIINQKGGENLFELHALAPYHLYKNNWNLELCKEGLKNHHYSILEGWEMKGEVRFKSVSSFIAFVKENSLLKLNNIEEQINQFFFIHELIKKNGSFSMKTHHFYVVARKNAVNE